MTGWKAPTCECGHVMGDHKSSGGRGLRAVGPGVCLIPGCGCREFVEVKETDRAAA